MRSTEEAPKKHCFVRTVVIDTSIPDKASEELDKAIQESKVKIVGFI